MKREVIIEPAFILGIDGAKEPQVARASDLCGDDCYGINGAAGAG